jgi:ribonuclease HI
VFCDGSGYLEDGEAKPAGIGVVILCGDDVLEEVGDPIGLGTNIVAELRALRRGLHLAATKFPGIPATVYSDSEWSLKACVPTCDWNIRDAALRKLVEAIRVQYRQHGQVSFVHCHGHRGLKDAIGNPLEERIIRANNRADELANIGRKRNTT